MIDYSEILDPDWFEELEISEPFGDLVEDLYLPIDYAEYDSTLYSNGFLGNDEEKLFKDLQKNEYIMRIAFREPIGDYGSHWVFKWYRSLSEHLNDIKLALEEAGAEFEE